jgi:FMN phosphatase YigB (HAD superfamily)
VKIEALLFDLGKVLVDFNFDLGMQRFASRSGLDRLAFEQVLFDAAWLPPYERGEISSVQYHRHLCESGKLDMGLDEFHASWSSVFLPDLLVPEALIAHLSERYPLILVSNTNESHVRYIERNYNVLRYFKVKIFSHVVGWLKPDRRIYEAAIAAAGYPPDALFFTDDREENVRGAQDLGIHAHQFTTSSRLIEALHEYGIDTESRPC